MSQAALFRLISCALVHRRLLLPRTCGTLLPAMLDVAHHELQRAVAVCAALAALAGCRGRSPDAGGDTSLARDLAEAQLAGVAAGLAAGAASGAASGRATVPTTAADTTAIRDTTSGLDSAGRRTAASPRLPAAAVAHDAAPTAHVAAAAKKVASPDPCASSSFTDQTACVSRSAKRADGRLAALNHSIVSAVRKQQRVAARAPDPPYVRKLARAQAEWVSWRDGECKRRTPSVSGKLWASSRARCITELSDARAVDLNHILSQLRKH